MKINEGKLTGTQLFHYKSMKKNKVVAYLLGALLGGIGIHRLYCAEYTGFCFYLVFFLLSLLIPVLYVVVVIAFIFDFFYT